MGTVYRVGGGSRLSGLMLVAATAAVMFVGPTVISYLRKLTYIGVGRSLITFQLSWLLEL
jgi:hypothetical protein